jgi:hypothetical protein
VTAPDLVDRGNLAAVCCERLQCIKHGRLCLRAVQGSFDAGLRDQRCCVCGPDDQHTHAAARADGCCRDCGPAVEAGVADDLPRASAQHKQNTS